METNPSFRVWKKDKRARMLIGVWLRQESTEAGEGDGLAPHGSGAGSWAAVSHGSDLSLSFFAADLADCKLVSFPICIYKVLRSVSDQIHLITLANNELKSLTSKFMTTFHQLRGRPRVSPGKERVTSQPLPHLQGLTPSGECPQN